MGIGSSIFLIAVGAILRFAVNVDTDGFSIATAGTILMVVGVVGLLISVLWMTIWAERGDRADVVAVRDRPVVRERDVY